MEVIKHAKDDVGHFLINKGANVNVFGFDGKTARTIHINGSIRRRLNEMGAALGVEDNDWMQFLDLEPEAEPENTTGLSKVNTTLFKGGRARSKSRKSKSKSKPKRSRKHKTKRC